MEERELPKRVFLKFLLAVSAVLSLTPFAPLSQFFFVNKKGGACE